MEKKTASVIMLTTLLVCILTFAFGIPYARAPASTITVPDDYPTIQEAINHANSGDTIYVRAGTYNERPTFGITPYPKNNITLMGESSSNTVVTGGFGGDYTNYDTIMNFEILGSTDFGAGVESICWGTFETTF